MARSSAFGPFLRLSVLLILLLAATRPFSHATINTVDVAEEADELEPESQSPPQSQPCADEHHGDIFLTADPATFQRMLDLADPPALHAALHHFSPQRFKHGAFSKDRTAAEAIHHDDPDLATAIVSIAKRQDTGGGLNTSASAAPGGGEPVQTSVVTISPESSPTVVVIETTTPSENPFGGPSSLPGGAGPVSVSTPIESQQPTVSSGGSGGGSASTPESASPASSSSIAAPSESSPSPSQSSGSGSGSSGVSSSAGSGSGTSSSPAGSETTSAPGSSSFSQGGGSSSSSSGEGGEGQGGGAGGQRHTSVVLQTVSLPNGAQSTITSFAIVGGGGGGNGGSGGSPTEGAGGPSGTSSGSLQSQGVAPNLRIAGWQVAGVVGGAVGLGMAL